MSTSYFQIEEPVELTAKTISQLESISKDEIVALSSNDVLLLASQPNYEVQDTKYISKSIALGDLKDALHSSLSIDNLKSDINALSIDFNIIHQISADLSVLDPNGHCYVNDSADMQISDPYIISSIAFSNGNITSLSGYSFKSALNAILSQNQINNIIINNISCSNKATIKTLHINQLLEIGENCSVLNFPVASKNTGGIVKIVDSSIPDTNQTIFVRMDQPGRLFINVNAISAAIYDSIKTQLIKDLQYQTAVVDRMPSANDLQPNTIYYVKRSNS